MNFASITTSMLQTTLNVQNVLTELDLCVENIVVHHDENTELSLASTQVDASEYSIFIEQNAESIHDKDVVIRVFTQEDEKLQLIYETDNVETFREFMSAQS